MLIGTTMKTHTSPRSFFKHNLRMAKVNASYMNHSGSKEEKKTKNQQ